MPPDNRARSRIRRRFLVAQTESISPAPCLRRMEIRLLSPCLGFRLRTRLRTACERKHPLRLDDLFLFRSRSERGRLTREFREELPEQTRLVVQACNHAVNVRVGFSQRRNSVI